MNPFRPMRFTLLSFVLLCHLAIPGAQAIPLGLDVLESGAPERYSLSFYRYEKNNAWWVNLGLPTNFFENVQDNAAEIPVYSLKGLEYGLAFSAWPLEWIQSRLTLPIESNTFTDKDLKSRSSVRPGDVRWEVSCLGWGRRTGDLRVAGVAGLVLPAGVSPLRAEDPILATGLGVWRAWVGLWASQRVGRFSLFQWINYEKSSSLGFDRFADIEAPGSSLDWPDRVTGGVRGEWAFFRRGPREASLVGALRVRWWDDWRVTGQGWGEQGVVVSPSDRIFEGSLGLRVRTDRRFTLEGRWTYFPMEWSYSMGRPDYGSIITLVLVFHPFEGMQAR